MIIVKEEGYIHRILETAGRAHHAKPCGEGPALLGGRGWKGRKEESMTQSFCWASGGRNAWGRVGTWSRCSVAFVVVQSPSRVWLCDPMHCSTPGLPVLRYLPEFAQTHVHQVSDTTQPSHPLSPPSPPTFNLSQHQGLFLMRVSSSHQVARVLELQLQHQSFQWIFRIDFL